MTHVTRREFLRLAGLMGGASLFAGCNMFDQAGPVPRYIEGAPGVDPVETLQGIENIYTVCGLCPGNCGIRCRIAGGVPVKIDGSPYNPISAAAALPFDTPLEEAALHGGSVCAVGGSGIQTLYNPFRVARPLKRVGPRGSSKWKALSWEQALREIVEGGNLFGEGKVEGLGEIKASREGLGFLAGRIDWGAEIFLKRFISGFPGAKLFRDREVMLNRIEREASDAVYGRGTGPVTADYRQARFVLSFGDAPLDSGAPLVSLARNIADARVRSSGFQWIVADPRLSTSGSKADRWLPVIPGKDMDLALGIMRALADNFADATNFPAESLKQIVESRTLKHYADACGISSENIIRVARHMVEAGPAAAAIPGKGVIAQPNGLETAKAVLTLNLMVGSSPGTGGLTGRRDDLLKQAEKKLLNGSAPNDEPAEYGSAVKALIQWRADPVYQAPDRAEAFFNNRQKVPLFVAIDHAITETSALADYILPDTTYLERWDICASPPSVTESGIGVRTPVVGTVDPRTRRYFSIIPQAKLMEDILTEMGAKLGLTGSQAAGSKDFKSAWYRRQEAFSALLEAMKIAGFPVSGSKQDLTRVLERGGIFAPRNKTNQAQEVQSSPNQYKPPAVIPNYAESPAHPDSFELITYTLPFHRTPPSGLNKWLLEVLPENRVIINNTDARKLNVHPHDQVIIETLDGKTKLQIKALVAPGIRPGVIAVANGFGYKQAGARPYSVDDKQQTAESALAAGVNPAELSRQTVKVKRV